MPHAITCNDIHFTWPSGETVFAGLSLAVDNNRIGLLGTNGSGKSTLLRILTGRLRSDGGSIQHRGQVGYLPQNFTFRTALRVDEALGVGDRIAALHAIECGDTDEQHFATVGDDWDVAERTRATLDRLGLEHVELDRGIAQLSGGESVLLGLAAEMLRQPDVLLLDEPTNNLDIHARQHLYETIREWRGALLVVSHDRELLELVDEIVELRDGTLRRYGGNFSAYERALAIEQEAAARTVRGAESDLRRQQRELVEARTNLARSKQYAQKMHDNKRAPKVVMNERERQAQVSAGKHLNTHVDRIRQARTRLDEAESAVRDDDEIRVDLPDTSVPHRRGVLALEEVRLLTGKYVDLRVRGPERIALTGRNGSGKTTLLRTISGELAPLSGTMRVNVNHRFMPQHLDVLDADATVFANIQRFAPNASTTAVRAGLARFLFTGDRVHQQVGTLSGGERFRATMAALLLAEPAPQLLLLDEPTNNLDHSSVRQLCTALYSYRGAMIIASHDRSFLRSISPTRWLSLDGG